MKNKLIYIIFTALFLSSFSLWSQDNLLEIEDASPAISLEGRIPLFLVHGWNYDGKPAPPTTGQWNNFLNYLLNDPELKEFYKPYFIKYWSNAAPVSTISGLLRDKIQQAGFHEKEFIIVAHSMGGLVSRSLMNEQYFNNGKKCGDNVRLLITLGTPHHGSPMANGPSRDAKVDGIFMKLALSAVESMAFKETKYNEVNRSDLRWDNYDNLFDYNKYPSEKNDWLTNLNLNTVYDSRTICYSSTVTGVFKLPPLNSVKEQYQDGAFILKDIFKMENDGIVPIQSSSFQGHNMKLVRFFEEHNHAEINTGLEGSTELYDSLKFDLMNVVPPIITWPVVKNEFLRNSQFRYITWKAPSVISNVNIYLSLDSGTTYNKVAENINARTGMFNWFIPDTNSVSCLMKVADAANESNFTVSDNPFIIYQNKIVFNFPKSKSYFVPNKANSISWQQYGLSDSVKITYFDPKNNYTKELSPANPVTTTSNTFEFIADSSFPPTDSAFISIQMLGMEKYYDPYIYTFTSEPFMFLGLPDLSILYPTTNPIDFLGITGEKFHIDSLKTISWQTEGEINFVKINLCDSTKKVIKTLIRKNHKPGFGTKGTYNWKIPEYYGDKFYLLFEGGPKENDISVSRYTEYPFRINRQTEIIYPADKSQDVGFLPCVEAKKMSTASEYKFEINELITGETGYYKEYTSSENTLCVPVNIEEELIAGKTYSLTAQAFSNGIPHYKSQISFMVKEMNPDEFQIISPNVGTITRGNELEIEWQRAPGALEYNVKIQNQGKIIFNNTYSRSDTSIIAQLGNPGLADTLFLEVTASNEFGNTISERYFFKGNRTSNEQMKNEQIKITVFPNPSKGNFNIEMFLPETYLTHSIEGGIYNQTGQNVYKFDKENLLPEQGALKLNYNQNINKALPAGIYWCIFKINDKTLTQKFTIIK